MITLILMLALVGFLLWVITVYIPMPEPFKKAIVVIALVLVVLYLLNIFGLDLPMPHR